MSLINNPWERSIKKGPLSYDPEMFYTRATDVRGHSQKLTTAFPPEVMAQIMQMVSNPDLPYRSPGEVVRDGVVHVMALRLEQIKDPAFKESFQDVTENLRWEQEVDKVASEASRFESSRDKLRASMTQLQKLEDADQMEVLIHRTRQWTQSMSHHYATLMDREIRDWEERVSLIRSATLPAIA